MSTKIFIESFTNWCLKYLKHKNVKQVYEYLHYKLCHLTNKIKILINYLPAQTLLLPERLKRIKTFYSSLW